MSEEISLDSSVANNINIDAAQSVSINAGEDVVVSSNRDVSVSAIKNADLMSGEDMSLTAKNIATFASEGEQHNSDNLSLLSKSEIKMNSKKIEIDSAKENLVLSSGGDVDAKAKGKVNLF
jgi:uncharacterized protein (DUF2345 family)